jgi:hypothetical protein
MSQKDDDVDDLLDLLGNGTEHMMLRFGPGGVMAVCGICEKADKIELPGMAVSTDKEANSFDDKLVAWLSNFKNTHAGCLNNN